MLAYTNISDYIHMASPAEALVYMTGFVIVLVGPTIVFGISDYITDKSKQNRDQPEMMSRR
ncbi:MAG: hypothetical protein WA947_14090 [Phormidesmis sp.]